MKLTLLVVYIVVLKCCYGMSMAQVWWESTVVFPPTKVLAGATVCSG